MPKIRSFTRRSFLETAVYGGGAAALAGAFPRPAIAQPRDISIFLGTTPDYANIWVAKQKGYFEEAGLNVALRLFPSGSVASDAFRAGQAEFLSCGDVPAVRLWKVMGTRYLAPVVRDFHSLVLVTKSGIKSGEDLKGKMLATQTGSGIMAVFGLINEKYGLAKGDYKITNIEPSDMVIALEGGTIDGFLWASPFEQRAIEISGDKVHVLLRGEELGWPNSVGLITRADLIEKERPMVQNVVGALARASDWCMANKEETSDIVAKALNLEPKIAAVTQVMDFRTAFDHVLYKYQHRLAQWMLDNKIIDKPIDWENYFDTSFLKTIDPSRVEEMKSSY